MTNETLQIVDHRIKGLQGVQQEEEFDLRTFRHPSADCVSHSRRYWLCRAQEQCRTDSISSSTLFLLSHPGGISTIHHCLLHPGRGEGRKEPRAAPGHPHD